MRRVRAALVSLLAAALPAQVEVLAGPGPPGELLQEQLAKGGDEFVLFDTGCVAQDLVVTLQVQVCGIEYSRLAALERVLPRIAASGDATDPDAAHVRSLARVAMALLHLDVELGREEQAELDDVLAGRTAAPRFVPATTQVDWRAATPRGIYSHRGKEAGLARVFTASVYLRACLQAMPAAARACWAKAVETGPQEDRDTLQQCDAALELLYGSAAKPAATGVPGTWIVADATLLTNVQAASPWDALCIVHRDVDEAPDRCVRGAFLHAAHVLTTEAPTSPLLAAMSLDRWQAKWRDTADWLYLALREIDVYCASRFRAVHRWQPPRVLIEPLPESFAALRQLEQMLDKLGCSRSPWARADHESKWWPDLVAELEAQAKEGEPDVARQQRLLAALVEDFHGHDAFLGTESHLDGIPGALRRARPFLVRVPIRWRGETKHALALRMYVEHAPQPDQWQPPPWGRALDQAPAARTR